MAFYFAYPVASPALKKFFGRDEAAIQPAAGPRWHKYSEELILKAQTEGRPVIVDFKADWCLACKELELYTFSDKRVYGQEDFLWLTFDATHDSRELQELKTKYKIIGLPHVVFYDRKGQWREDLTLTGFEKVDPFLQRMAEAAK